MIAEPDSDRTLYRRNNPDGTITLRTWSGREMAVIPASVLRQPRGQRVRQAIMRVVRPCLPALRIAGDVLVYLTVAFFFWYGVVVFLTDHLAR